MVPLHYVTCCLYDAPNVVVIQQKFQIYLLILNQFKYECCGRRLQIIVVIVQLVAVE